jgi:YidC/Oxa1 family membrane protein insertase
LPEIKNPSQEPGTERRLLLVFALTFLAVIISQQVLERLGPKPPATTTQSKSADGSSSKPASATGQSSAVQAPSSSAMSSSAPASAPARESIQPVEAKQAGDETETMVENDLYRITFTIAALSEIVILKMHTDEFGCPLNLVLELAASQY